MRWRTFSSWVVDVGIHYRDTYFQVSEDIWRKQQLFVRRARVIEQKAHIEQRASLSNGSEISDRTRANHPHHQMLMTEDRRASQKLTKGRKKIIIWLPPTSTRTILSSGSHLKNSTGNERETDKSLITIPNEDEIEATTVPGVICVFHWPVIAIGPISEVFRLSRWEVLLCYIVRPARMRSTNYSSINKHRMKTRERETKKVLVNVMMDSLIV